MSVDKKHLDVVLDTSLLRPAPPNATATSTTVGNSSSSSAAAHLSSSSANHAAPSSSAFAMRGAFARVNKNGSTAADDDDDDNDDFDIEANNNNKGSKGATAAPSTATTTLLRRRGGETTDVELDTFDDDESVVPRLPPANAPVFHDVGGGGGGGGSVGGGGGHGFGGGSEDRLYFATPFWRMFAERTMWLVALLLLQSYASLILQRFEALLQKHLVITLFLPMLIGAGGNASNQSAMVVVRGLALGEITALNVWRMVYRELGLAVIIGATMGSVAFVRVYLFHSVEGADAALAVGASTLAVMLLAVSLGTIIPLVLNLTKIDPAHAGPVVAVLVDLSGVAIICFVCQLILE